MRKSQSRAFLWNCSVTQDLPITFLSNSSSVIKRRWWKCELACVCEYWNIFFLTLIWFLSIEFYCDWITSLESCWAFSGSHAITACKKLLALNSPGRQVMTWAVASQEIFQDVSQVILFCVQRSAIALERRRGKNSARSHSNEDDCESELYAKGKKNSCTLIELKNRPRLMLICEFAMKNFFFYFKINNRGFA